MQERSGTHFKCWWAAKAKRVSGGVSLGFPACRTADGALSRQSSKACCVLLHVGPEWAPGCTTRLLLATRVHALWDTWRFPWVAFYSQASDPRGCRFAVSCPPQHPGDSVWSFLDFKRSSPSPRETTQLGFGGASSRLGKQEALPCLKL